MVLHGSAKLNTLKKARIYDAEPYEKESKRKPLNGNMVPIINASEYSKYARDIIKEYYGESYDFKEPIQIRDLAYMMGLTVKELHTGFSFEKDKAIFGQIYFEKTKAKFYNKKNDVVEEYIVPANTILYGSQCTSVFSLESIDITIAHEWCIMRYIKKRSCFQN